MFGSSMNFISDYLFEGVVNEIGAVQTVMILKFKNFISKCEDFYIGLLLT
jgi:hypothetical protein